MAGWHHDLMDMDLDKLWKRVKDRKAWHRLGRKKGKRKGGAKGNGNGNSHKPSPLG